MTAFAKQSRMSEARYLLKTRTYEPKKRPGTLYLLKCGPYRKIGYTRQTIKARISQLQKANPYPITLVMYADVFYPEEAEALIHAALEDCRHRGEWYGGKGSVARINKAFVDGIRTIDRRYGRVSDSLTN